ncbi:MAG: hypothetical protein J6J60_07015 [Clostridia bacterium]|nr:hypothetical protein [Clostridia bacterium]
MRKKQKNQKIMVVAIALLLLISIGYAAISTNLTITGTANIAATSWNVHFENVTPIPGSVSGTNVTTVPSVSTNSITTTELTYNVTLEKPGDFYEFTVNVVNGGTINAKIAENGIIKTMKIGGNDLTAAQAKLVSYTVAYADGTEIAEGDTLGKSGTANNGDTRTIRVRVQFNTGLTNEELNAVDSDMALTLKFGLNYVQD